MVTKNHQTGPTHRMHRTYILERHDAKIAQKSAIFHQNPGIFGVFGDFDPKSMQKPAQNKAGNKIKAYYKIIRTPY